MSTEYPPDNKREGNFDAAEAGLAHGQAHSGRPEPGKEAVPAAKPHGPHRHSGEEGHSPSGHGQQGHDDFQGHVRDEYGDHAGYGHDDHAGHGHDDHAGHGHDDHAEHGHDDHAEHGHDDHAEHGHEDHAGHGHDDHAEHGHDDHAGHGHDDHAEHGQDDHAGHEHDDHAGHGHDDHAGHEHDDHAGHGHDDHAGHGHHDHDHAAELREASRRSLFIALALIGTFMVVEVVGGLLSGSLALLADAGHMLTDAASIVLALFAVWIAGRPESIERTFGYQRTEVLAAGFNALSLWVIAA